MMGNDDGDDDDDDDDYNKNVKVFKNCRTLIISEKPDNQSSINHSVLCASNVYVAEMFMLPFARHYH